MRIVMLGVKGIPAPGGIETTVEELGSRLVTRGHEVIVFTRPHYSGPAAVHRGIRTIPKPSIRTKHLEALSHTLFSLPHALRLRPDAVVIHSSPLSVLALVPRLARVPVLVHCHGMDWKRAKWGPLARRLIRMADWTSVRFPTLCSSVSRAQCEDLERRFGRRVRLIPNGVSPAEPVPPQLILGLGLQPDRFLLFLSRLVPEKGLHLLIEAHERLRPELPLVVAGAGTHSGGYEAAMRAHASESIRFLGFVSGRLRQELLCHASLVVQPSEIEGLSNTVLEAMSYGRAVLASDIPENLEAIGDCGYRFAAGSSTALESALRDLLARPDNLRQTGLRARERVLREFTWDRAADLFERALLDACSCLPKAPVT